MLTVRSHHVERQCLIPEFDPGSLSREHLRILEIVVGPELLAAHPLLSVELHILWYCERFCALVDHEGLLLLVGSRCGFLAVGGRGGRRLPKQLLTLLFLKLLSLLLLHLLRRWLRGLLYVLEELLLGPRSGLTYTLEDAGVQVTGPQSLGKYALNGRIHLFDALFTRALHKFLLYRLLSLFKVLAWWTAHLSLFLAAAILYRGDIDGIFRPEVHRLPASL